MLNKKRVLIILSGIILWSISINAQVMDSPPRDGVYDRISSPNRKPIPYAPLREADALWTKRIWRVIDMREKINQPFYYPVQPQNGRRSFMQVILDALKEGSITAYDAGIGNDEFLVPITLAEIMKNLSKNDSTEVTDTMPPYNTHWTKIKHEFDPSAVKQLRIKEDWFFDKQRSVMDVRIIGICPITEEYETDGVTFKGYKPLFWIYFPEARQVFAKADVFNRFNDAERRTYEDVFFKRMFNSYIYKESNVYDRLIKDYAKGMDALLESERIKNDIFLFEHDLWEY
jgi:gliding motility associated protien GldN